jgi:hypothetical protein
MALREEARDISNFYKFTKFKNIKNTTRPSTWFYCKNWLSCDRKYESRIEEIRKVCAAINSFETVFSKNVNIFFVFLCQQTCKKNLVGRRPSWEISILSDLTWRFDLIWYDCPSYKKKPYLKKSIFLLLHIRNLHYISFKMRLLKRFFDS